MHLFCCGGSVHLVLRPFSEENYSVCSYKFVVSVGGNEFRVFLCHHLDPSPIIISRIIMTGRKAPIALSTPLSLPVNLNTLRITVLSLREMEALQG